MNLANKTELIMKTKKYEILAWKKKKVLPKSGFKKSSYLYRQKIIFAKLSEFEIHKV